MTFYITTREEASPLPSRVALPSQALLELHGLARRIGAITALRGAHDRLCPSIGYQLIDVSSSIMPRSHSSTVDGIAQ